MGEEFATDTKSRLLEAALAVTAEAGIDPSKIDFNQIPPSIRARVAAMLMVIAEHAAEKVPTSPVITIALPGDIRRLVDSLRLEQGFADALETQKTFQLLRTGERFPDIDQVLKTFTPEMLAMATTFQNPTLVLRPRGRSFNDMVTAMNANKTSPKQEDAFVDGIFKKDGDIRLANHGAYIVEGGNGEMSKQNFDDPEDNLAKRLTTFAAHKKANNVSGVDRWTYIALLMQSLKNEQPIDTLFWTNLDEDPALSETVIPRGCWELCTDPEKDMSFPSNHRYRAGFHSTPLDSSTGYTHGQFRRSVGGNVPSF